MIKSATHFWQTLNEKQQVCAVIFSMILICLLVFVSLYVPLNAQNQALNTQLQAQQRIQQQLFNVQKHPLKFIGVADVNRAKSVVVKMAKQKALKVDVRLDGQTLALSAKDQAFEKLNRLLLSLRQQYAITATRAVISKTKDGFVDADLTLSLP